MNQSENDPNTWLFLLIAGIVAAFIFGGTILQAARDWLLTAGVLVQTGLVIEFPWMPGLGLDMPRTVCAAAIAALLLFLFINFVRRHRGTDQGRR